MAKPSNLSALALVSSDAMRADKTELARLQSGIAAQFKVMSQLREEEALRGLFVGLALHRIKVSLPYGEFGKWVKANIASFGDRYVNYLMKLALAFVEANKVSGPELLAAPAANDKLELTALDGAQRKFVAKAVKFVGDKSLHELFQEHGVKDAAKLGGARTAGAKNTKAPDAEQLYLFARDEIGGVIARAEELLVKENQLQHLAGHAEEINGVVSSLRALADKVEKAAKPLLKK